MSILEIFAVLWILSGICSIGGAFYALACNSTRKGIRHALTFIEKNTYHTILLSLLAAAIRAFQVFFAFLGGR